MNVRNIPVNTKNSHWEFQMRALTFPGREACTAFQSCGKMLLICSLAGVVVKNDERFAAMLRRMSSADFICLVEVLVHRQELELPQDPASPADAQQEAHERR